MTCRPKVGTERIAARLALSFREGIARAHVGGRLRRRLKPGRGRCVDGARSRRCERNDRYDTGQNETDRHARAPKRGARIYMPAEEASVSVRERASHTGQPWPVRPTFVVVLVRDRVVGQRLTAAFRPMPVQVVHCAAELHSAVARQPGDVACVIAEARDAAHEPSGPVVSALIRRFPTMPVLGYCGAGARHAADLRDLARAGVHELVFADVDDHPALLRAKLSRGEEACAAAAVLRGIDGLLPPVLSRLAEYCVQFPRDSHEISRIAAALGVHRKTLVNWCERAHVPPPSTLVTWVRLLLAAELLHSPGQSVEHVANTLEFASPTAFRNLCRRYLGMRPSELRTKEGRDAVYRAFAEALTDARRTATRDRARVMHRPMLLGADSAAAHAPRP